ncbi:MAG TPA: hypothetical protein VH539_10380 [Gemmatimonadaceae bacterium]
MSKRYIQRCSTCGSTDDVREAHVAGPGQEIEPHELPANYCATCRAKMEAWGWTVVTTSEDENG